PEIEEEDARDERLDGHDQDAAESAEDDSAGVADRGSDHREHAPDDQNDEERHHDHAEDRPAVAAHQLPAPPESAEDALVLDHDRRGDDGPDRDQDQPGDDQGEEPEEDRESVEDPVQDQGGDVGSGCLEQLAHGAVPPAVPDVLDELDDVPGVEHLADQADDQAGEEEDDAAGQPEEVVDQGGDADHDQRAAEQGARLVPVGLERLADHPADLDPPSARLHGGLLTSILPRPHAERGTD